MSRCAQTCDDQIEIEWFDERVGHVSSDLPNVFVDEEWYETVLLPFVSIAPTWEEFVGSKCRLFSCTAGLYLCELAMVENDDGTKSIFGQSGKVNKRGQFKLILRDQNCKAMTRSEGVYVNADGEGHTAHRTSLSSTKLIDLCWDICIPFRALIPKALCMNPPSLPYQCMTQRTSPHDVEFKFFDRERNRYANEIQAIYLNETWFKSIQPHFYTGPEWKEFVSSESLECEQSHGPCHIMTVAAGLQLGLLILNGEGKPVASATP